jgi:IQ calmodulin-binding motif
LHDSPGASKPSSPTTLSLRQGKAQETTPPIAHRWQRLLAKEDSTTPPVTDLDQEQVSAPNNEPATVAVATATAFLQKPRTPDPLIEKKAAVQTKAPLPSSPTRVQSRGLPPRAPVQSKVELLEQKKAANGRSPIGARKDVLGRLVPVGDVHLFEDMALRMYVEAAIRIQSVFRGFWVRDCLNVDHYCATVIQKSFRGLICLVDYQYDLYRIMVVQSVWRMNIAQRHAVRVHRSIIKIQAIMRCFLATKVGMRKKLVHAQTVRVQEAAATSIQTAFRQYSAELVLIRTLVDVLIVQSVARGWLARQEATKYRQEKKMAERKNVVARYRVDAMRTTRLEWDTSGAESTTLRSLSLDTSDVQGSLRLTLGSSGSRDENCSSTIHSSMTPKIIESTEEEEVKADPTTADSKPTVAVDDTCEDAAVPNSKEEPDATVTDEVDRQKSVQDKSDDAVIHDNAELTAAPKSKEEPIVTFTDDVDQQKSVHDKSNVAAIHDDVELKKAASTDSQSSAAKTRQVVTMPHDWESIGVIPTAQDLTLSSGGSRPDTPHEIAAKDSLPSLGKSPSDESSTTGEAKSGKKSAVVVITKESTVAGKVSKEVIAEISTDSESSSAIKPPSPLTPNESVTLTLREDSDNNDTIPPVSSRSSKSSSTKKVLLPASGSKPTWPPPAALATADAPKSCAVSVQPTAIILQSDDTRQAVTPTLPLLSLLKRPSAVSDGDVQTEDEHDKNVSDPHPLPIALHEAPKKADVESGGSGFKPVKVKTSKLALRYQEELRKAELEKTEMRTARRVVDVKDEIHGLAQISLSTPRGEGGKDSEKTEEESDAAAIKTAESTEEKKTEDITILDNIVYNIDEKKTPSSNDEMEMEMTYASCDIETKKTEESNEGTQSEGSSTARELEEYLDNLSVLDGNVSENSIVKDSLEIMKLVEENMMAKYSPRRLLPSNAERTLLGPHGNAASSLLLGNEDVISPSSCVPGPRTPQASRPLRGTSRNSDLHAFAQSTSTARSPISHLEAAASGQGGTSAQTISDKLVKSRTDEMAHTPHAQATIEKAPLVSSWHQESLQKTILENETQPTPCPTGNDTGSSDRQLAEDGTVVESSPDAATELSEGKSNRLSAQDILILDKSGDPFISEYKVWHDFGLLKWRPAQSPDEADGKPTTTLPVLIPHERCTVNDSAM